MGDNIIYLNLHLRRDADCAGKTTSGIFFLYNFQSKNKNARSTPITGTQQLFTTEFCSEQTNSLCHRYLLILINVVRRRQWWVSGHSKSEPSIINITQRTGFLVTCSRFLCYREKLRYKKRQNYLTFQEILTERLRD